MDKNNKISREEININEKIKKTPVAIDRLRPVKVVLAIIVIIMIILVMSIYTYIQRKNVINNAEYITRETADYIADSISKEIDYANSSIKLSAVTVSQTMTSKTLENPSEVIKPMLANTPFGAIEYIRDDGMNVMNIGESFDASDRVYYKEGIKGNTGIWNNYHPKMSKDTLINFYTPLLYKNEISGVITGYIEANRQLLPLFQTDLYGRPVHGLLLDENNMVICSTVLKEYESDLTFDRFLEKFDTSIDQKNRLCEIINNATDTAVSYKDPEGEGRICATLIPDTKWKVVVMVPAESFNSVIAETTKSSIFTIFIIALILIVYATYILLSNFKRRREITAENVKLENENRKAIEKISEIRDIISSANMGTWRIKLVEGKEPRMHADQTMKKLLGIEDCDYTPERIYTEWYSKITPDAVPSVLKSVERMQQGYFDENTYLWEHPKKGVRYVRCGGTAQPIEGGYMLSGYHYDVDDVVREDLAKVVMLQDALNEKNEYYSTLGALGDVFYSMHVIDLKEDTAIEFNAKNQVKEIANHKNGAFDMMFQVMRATATDDYREKILEFANLRTLPNRMKNKKIISKEFLGRNVGWVLISFIAMDRDEEGRPTKVICTTRIIDDEKKQEEKLIKKSHTDELTGMYNRRAYEEDLLEYDNKSNIDDYIYISLDVNGLKVVNDTKGHMAGDELIVGACYCMARCFETYGKVYRVGGDEFVAFICCDEKQLKTVLDKFDFTVNRWEGKLIDSLSVSYGCASKKENPEASIRQLGVIAEERMYANKEAHYKKTGVDRRGQQDAHKALCELYTKILKINVSEDSYQIINHDLEEQTEEKGFSSKLSEWLKRFGTTGQVHPEDLQEYLKNTDLNYIREYFSENKTSLHIFYRRKYKDTYKRVMMEIIPANDYSTDNQSMFLYVKDIDK